MTGVSSKRYFPSFHHLLTGHFISFTNLGSRRQSEKQHKGISEPRKEFTETEIEELILEHNLYDESLNSLVVDCHGKTPLHYSIIEKHENVINCFKEFDGRYWAVG